MMSLIELIHLEALLLLLRLQESVLALNDLVHLVYEDQGEETGGRRNRVLLIKDVIEVFDELLSEVSWLHHEEGSLGLVGIVDDSKEGRLLLSVGNCGGGLNGGDRAELSNEVCLLLEDEEPEKLDGTVKVLVVLKGPIVMLLASFFSLLQVATFLLELEAFIFILGGNSFGLLDQIRDRLHLP
jgi:hypothetical protein